MEHISTKIGERLREIRNLRQMTLDEVAKVTGVSKPMLGQIERGQSSPTINTLWKISKGLKVPLSFFCKQHDAEAMIAGLEEKNLITEENGGMKAYPLFPFDPMRNVETFYVEFEAGVKHNMEPQVNGVEKYIFVVEGSLRVEVGREAILLSEKQSLRFQADIFHAYHNVSDRLCAIHDMIFYPGY